MLLIHTWVGDTTYRDVVLKLNDFEVLVVGSDPLVGILEDNFVVQLISAVRKSEQLPVKLKVTSVGQDRDRDNHIVGVNTKARLTDDKGRIYDAASFTIPRINTTYKSAVPDHLFDADTPLEIIITFDNIAPLATKISLLDLVFYKGQSYKIRDIQFE
ncbi:MAG: hypothetical protein KAH20_01155 [Methylococcales bacterium]|nr:hypothetical protein [Methylococcales bacterium]